MQRRVPVRFRSAANSRRGSSAPQSEACLRASSAALIDGGELHTRRPMLLWTKGTGVFARSLKNLGIHARLLPSSPSTPPHLLFPSGARATNSRRNGIHCAENVTAMRPACGHHSASGSMGSRILPESAPVSDRLRPEQWRRGASIDQASSCPAPSIALPHTA